MYNPFKCEPYEIVGYRNPTTYEIKLGYGAIHYRTFDLDEWKTPSGRVKHWITADDGLRYYRPR